MPDPKGALVPLVMVPRFTSYLGASIFLTVALEVERYCVCALTVWRGPLQGGGSFTVSLQVSQDGNTWTTIGTPFDPGEDVAVEVSEAINSRWLRLKIVLTGAQPAASCWAAGTLERRTQ